MKNKNRIHFLDEVRGFFMILVVIYHFFYTAAVIYGYEELSGIMGTLRDFEPILPGAFILICGVSCSLSRSNIKRGLRLAAVAVMISLVMYIVMPSQMIWFGIIHFLAAATLLYGALKRYADRLPAVPTVIICALLFALTYNLRRGFLGFPGLFAVKMPDFLYTTNLTAPLGFYGKGFFSSDYFPLIPWLFLFAIGAALGRYAGSLPESLRRSHIPLLGFIGRHCLIIYLIHQPIFIGVFELINLIRR